ncbi:MAG: PLD nuclease N-terminal domain-containing protein [Salinibacterium sp.]|nr:PLD nuclease N-terminal domain-containing protein [Salinibacterium sp.]
MGRLLIFLIAALVVDVFAIVDLVLIDRRRIRAFNKFVWVIIIVAVPFVGALLWFIVGRGRADKAGQERSLAPDDNPAFLKNLRRDEEQDARIRRLEQELAELDDDPPKE